MFVSYTDLMDPLGSWQYSADIQGYLWFNWITRNCFFSLKKKKKECHNLLIIVVEGCISILIIVVEGCISIYIFLRIEIELGGPFLLMGWKATGCRRGSHKQWSYGSELKTPRLIGPEPSAAGLTKKSVVEDKGNKSLLHSSQWTWRGRCGMGQRIWFVRSRQE